MRVSASDKILSEEEYVKHEWTALCRSEFINGQLFEMPGEQDINNEIALRVAFLFMQFLKQLGYQVYAHDVKVKIFGENKYYYPDVFVTKELKTQSNKYIKSEPVLIVEVVSESSQVTDYVDKYIAYTKIPSLQYYLIIEPETTLITCYTKVENNEWMTVKYTHLNDYLKLERFNVAFQLKEIYPKSSIIK